MIQRYEIKHKKNDDFDYMQIEKSSCGDFVKYSDHIAEVEKKVCKWINKSIRLSPKLYSNSLYFVSCQKALYDEALGRNFKYCPYCGCEVKIEE